MSHPRRLGQDLRQFVFVASGFCAALIFSSPAQGAIAFDQASSAATKSSARSLSWTHVLGAGKNRVVIVGVTLDDNPSRQRERITVTFSGTALRAIPNADADAPGRDELTTRLFYALESSLPRAGAGLIEIRLSNKAQTIIGTAMSFAGVEQGVPRPADGNAFWRDSHSVRTRLKTEISGSWIVDVAGADDDDPLSPTTPGQTKRLERLGKKLTAAGSTLVAPDPGWQTVGWTHRTRDQLVHAAAVLRPVRYDLQVSIVGAGTVVPSGGTFIGDSIVSLRATPAAGNRFLSWSGDLAGAANPALLTMNADKHVTATFVRLVSLTTATNGNGAIIVDPAGPTYDAGTTITLTASAAPGNRFTGWSGALSGTDNPATLTLNADAAVTANFVPLVTLTTATNGNGTVTVDPAGPVYDVGATVTLTATASSGHRFTGWSGALSGSANPATLVLAGDASVTANFVAVYAVATHVTGQGAIALDPVAATYDAGTIVTATATPATGWQFSGWSGDLTGNTNPAALTVDANKTITAAFTEIAPPVAGITFDASASGTVVAGTTITWPHTIGSGANRALVVGVAVEDNSAAEMTVASATFNGTPLLAIAGTKISGGNSTNRDQSELFYLLETGLPAAGTYNVVVTFAGAVDGAVGGSTSLIGVKQTAPEAATSKSDTSGADVIATNITTLTAGAWIVDVVTSGNTGAFMPTGADQTERFDLSVAAVTSGMAGAGSTRTVATPGVTAMAWTHVNANRLMHSLAAFAPAIDVPLPSFGLTVTTNGSGSVAVNPALATYPAGSLVTLTATPDAGFQFAGWSGDLTGNTNPATLTMDAAKSVTATFTPVTPITYTLTINVTGSGSVVRNPDLVAYSPGAIVDLVAVPATGWSFTGWSGDLSGAATPNTITMDGNKVVTATFTADSGGAPDFGLYGWATTGAGTTGGAGGAEVVVNTLEDFKFYAGQTAPYIIKISGTITGNEDVRVRSNKSILGLGPDARFLGIGLTIGWNSEFGQINNVIIRNLTFEKAVAPIDSIAIAYGAHHVWVDHCNLFSERNGNIDFYDGLLDVTHGADFVTVSWCKFYEHYKTSLVGHSENNAAEDVGHLTVTYHHNSFIDSGGRNPSVRFGTVHVYNNYYLDLDDYAIASRQNAQVLIENNYFENVTRPIRADTSLSDVAGRVRGVATNIFVNCGPNSITSPEATWVPPYPYALTPVAGVPALVNAWAGVGILTFTGTPPAPVQPTIITAPAAQTGTAGESVTFSVTAGGTGPFAYQWKKNGVDIPGATGASYTIAVVQASDAGAYSVLISGPGGSITTTPVTLTVNAAPPPINATILLRERFADGDRTTQALPDSAAWFTSAGSSNFTATAGAATLNLSSSRTLLAYFTNDATAPVTVALDQTLTFEMVAQFTGLDPTGNLNVGLMRSVANPAAVNGAGFTANGVPNTNARVTGDFGSGAPASHVFANYTGYAALGTASAAATPIRLYARTGANDNIISSTVPFTQIIGDAATASAGLVAGVDYRFTFTLHHTSAGMALALDVTRVADDAVVMTYSAIDPAATFTSFDTLVFYKASGGATNLVIKSADVDLISPVVVVAPTITTSPASATVNVGDPIAFTVGVEGTAPFSYQWHKDGVDLAGETGATLSIAAAQLSSSGNYTVTVSNSADSVTSAPATLTVIVPPTILLRERFADGDRTTQALPASAAWFTSAGSSNFTATVGAATLNLSSSRTLLAYVTNGTGVTTNVAPGQTLTWDFVVQFTGAAPTGNMNLGLFRSVANPAAIVGTGFVPSGPPNTNARVTGDFGSGAPASGVFSLYQGYAAFATTSASATPVRLFARTGSDANILSSTGPMTQLAGVAPTPSTAFAAGVDYRLTFTLSNTGSGMDLVVSATNLADSSVAFTFSARDPATTFTAFDTIAFYKANGGATNLVIKSADVSLAGTLAGNAPTITSQPAPQTVLAGQPASFSVVASGTEPLSYRWQKNGAVIDGATSATFALASAQPSDAGTYRVTVSNDFGSALSNVALLTVNVPAVGPTITSQPASQTVAVGTNVTFNVTATGTAPLSYAWQKDGAPITGANGASLTLTNVQPADAGFYTVVVSNVVNSVTSDAALLTVNETPVGPTITVDPAGRSAFTGETVSFTVVVTGTAPLTYAWTKDGAAITGADAATLTLTNVALTDAGTYAAVVTNAVNSATSAGAVLTVAASPAAPGDIFVAPGGLAANPGTIALPTTFTNALTLIAPGSTIWMRGGTYAFSTQISIARTNTGLPGARKNIFAFAGEHPVLDFSSQPYGSTSSVSNPRGLQINGHFWHVRDLEVKGSADNGIYIGGNDNIIERCVTHSNRDSGLQLGRFSGSALRSEWPSFNLILNCESYDNYDSPPNGGENADGFACKLTTGAGNVFRGCIAHHNIDDGWDLFTNTDTGPIDPVVIDQCIAYQNGQLTNGTSSSAGDRNGFKLGGNSIPVIHTVTRSIAFGNGKNGFTFNSNPAAIRLINNLAFDNTQGNFKLDQPGPLFLNNVSLYTVGTGQNDRYGGNSGIATGPSNCFWFTGSSSRGPSINDQGLTVSTASFVTLALPAGGFARAADGAIAPGDFGRPVAGSPLINAGEIPPAAILAELPFDVSTWYEGLPDIGVVETFLLVATPPSILLQPASQAVAEGGNAAFTVLATGSIPLAYQWSRDGNVLPGETQSTLDLVGVQPADGGVYTVLVSNPFGTAPSDPATLTIGLPVAPAIITPPASKTVTVGATVSFTVEATGTGPLGFQWSKDGVNLPSANADTLVLSNVQLVDAGSYVVTVSNLVTSVASAPATLTVNAPVPATILLQERFADGDRTSQALPASAAWFTSAGSSNFTATVGAATQNISSSRTLVAYFTNGAGAPVLVASAQVLTLDLVVQFTGGDPIGNLNFSLMRSVANPAAVNGTGFTASGAPNTNARVTGDFGSGAPTSHVFANYTGYAALGTVSASATPVRLYARTGANDNIISSTAPFVQLTSTGTGSPGLVAGVDYRLTLTVAHTGAGMAIAFDVTRVGDGAVVMSQSALDAAATFTEFDTLVLYKASGGATNLVIKSADVDLITPAP